MDKKLYPISCYGGVKNGPPKTKKKSQAGSWNRGAAPRWDRVPRELLTLPREPAEGGSPDVCSAFGMGETRVFANFTRESCQKK